MDMKATEGCTYLSQLRNKPLIRFILRPQTITRTVSWIFSVVICGSIMSGGFQNLPISSELNCVLNENPAACGYGIGLGIATGLLCLLFLLLDFFIQYIQSSFFYKIICIADFICSVFCAVLWFIGFCFLAHQWALTVPNAYLLGVENSRTAMVFSFFSVPCWLVLSYLAFLRLSSTPADDYQSFTEEAIFPAMRRLSSSMSGQVDPLHSNSNLTPNISAQEMDNTFQNGHKI